MANIFKCGNPWMEEKNYIYSPYKGLPREVTNDVSFKCHCNISSDKSGEKLLSTLKGVAAVSRALSMITNIMDGDGKYGGISVCKDESIVCQYTDYNGEIESNGKYPSILFHISKDGEDISACRIDEYGCKKPYTIVANGTDEETSTPFFFALTVFLTANDPVIGEEFDKLYAEKKNEYVVAIGQDISFLWKKRKAAESYINSIELIEPREFDTFDMFNGDFVPEDDKTWGDISLCLKYQMNQPNPDSVTYGVSELAGKFSPNPERVLTDEEKAMIPVIPSDYQIPEHLLEAAELVKGSKDCKKTFRNFLLTGPSGTGKSEWAKMLAYACGLPFLSLECSTDMEKRDFSVDYIPNTKYVPEPELIAQFTQSMPSRVDMMLDPAGSYQRITGVAEPNATEDMAWTAYLQKYSETLARNTEFVAVDSKFKKALENGWVISIEEPTIIENQGVLPSLNPTSDKSQLLTNADGTTTKRHPDSIIVYSTNTDYSGCHELNQSVLSRQVRYTLNDVSDVVLSQRITSETGFNNKAIINKMIAVYRQMKQLAATKGIEDGAIDIRSLIDWGAANLINGKIYSNGMNMLVNKGSQQSELIKEFITCLDSKFTPEDDK